MPRPQTVGVLGSLCNPPHLGHLLLASEAAWQLGLDKVLLVPTGIPPHRDPPRESAELRTRLAAALVTCDPVLELCRIEADKEGVLVLECGGKGNIPLFARLCNACGIPYVVVHDRDAPEGKRPVESERVINRQIREVAGRGRTVVLVPDFEAVSGVNARGRGRKPRKAWTRYSGNGDVPAPLQRAVEKVRRAAGV